MWKGEICAWPHRFLCNSKWLQGHLKGKFANFQNNMHYLLPASPPSHNSSIYSLLHSCHLQCTNLSRLYFDMYLPWTFAHIQWPLLYNKYLTFHSVLSFYFPVSLPGYIVLFGYIRGFLIFLFFRPVVYNGFCWISSDNKYLLVFFIIILLCAVSPQSSLQLPIIWSYKQRLAHYYPSHSCSPSLYTSLLDRILDVFHCPLIYSMCHASSKFSKPWILIMCPRNFLISLLSHVFAYSWEICWSLLKIWASLLKSHECLSKTNGVYLKTVPYIMDFINNLDICRKK